jgi:hypothetical protein
MTREELNFIKDSFSQIIDDIAGNPDWHEAARAVASDLGTLERELGEKVASLPSNLDEAAKEQANIVDNYGDPYGAMVDAFKSGAEWMAGPGETFKEVPVYISYGDEKEINLTIVIEGTSFEFLETGDKVIVQIRKK